MTLTLTDGGSDFQNNNFDNNNYHYFVGSVTLNPITVSLTVFIGLIFLIVCCIIPSIIIGWKIMQLFKEGKAKTGGMQSEQRERSSSS